MSITERPVAEALKTLLVNNEPFQYAHLIKFERPSRPDSLSGLVSTAKQRYTYLTDASINVSFDDGSRDLQGVANGTQVYLANKVLSVGAVQEQTKATTSNTTLVLDGNALGAEISGTATITLVSAGVWDIVYAAPITLDDLLAQGFREGDKVTVNDTPVNIQSFRSGNALRVTQIDTALSSGTGIVALKLASEEIISILLDKNAPDYASFINREVFIYRGYFKEGVIVGEPTCIFKGIITGVSFEDSESAIKVSWSLSSHWSDFAQVKGRVTSDSAHRALDANGAPQVASALKPIYAYDKGFIHAETSVNMLTKYSVQVPDQDIKSKKGFLGIGASVKVRKFTRLEDRFTNLDFQLQAKAIPVVYGVRKVDSIPIFADTLKDNSAEVYVASVICEGEIGGIYDVIIDGNSLICNDKADFDARSTQTGDNTVEVICRGRADKGDVLNGSIATTGTYQDFYIPSGELISISNAEISNIVARYRYSGYLPPEDPIDPTNNFGLIDGSSLPLTMPSNMTLDIFTGKSGQKASSQLSQIAFQKNFKIQNSYWLGNDTYEYWGPNHRLLDTAYVVGKFIIAEGDTTIPEINFVVRGKVIDCYNYDYSFLHDDKSTGESHSNFLLGDSVTLWDGETKLNDAQIIDKWTFRNPDGTENVRFRFDVIPALNYDADGRPGIKKFQMKSGANTWTMVTHNYNILGAEFGSAGTVNVAGPVAQLVSSPVLNTSGSLGFTFSASNADMPINGDASESSALFQLVRLVGGAYENIPNLQTFTSAIMGGTATSASFTSRYPHAQYSTEATAVLSGGNTYLASKNTVRLPASASSTDGFYNGYLIEITRYNSSTGKSLVQLGEIVGYNGARKIATIDSIWDFIPIATDSLRIFPKYADSRVSTNPAIQLLDYVTSPSYGKGLNPTKDLNLPSWLDTARRCDTRSDVTVLDLSGTPVAEDVYAYRYTDLSGKVITIWQGTVASVSGNYVTFTSVLGKLTNKWNSWKVFKTNEIVYNSSGSLFIVTATDGRTFPTEPVTGAIPDGMSALGSLSLTRLSGTGTNPLPINISAGNPVQSIRNGQKISGYSIYDCDDINYWRMAGWDEHAQRYATKDQCNIVVDTSAPLSDNVNGMLEHFNGILRYTAGKYFLDLEEQEGDIDTNSVRTITVDDIIGKIQLSDEGTRSAFNSLTASFADPANKFEARNVSFFNSEYLKADRNVPKKGNLSIPGITNYYNSRALADSFLNKSRFGLTVSLTIRPSGFLLLAGSVIQIIYPRYDWGATGKKFRIESINYQPDGLVDIVAKEYDNSFYTASNIRRVGGTGATTVPTTSTPVSPTVLTASQTEYNQIVLSWNPGTDAGPGSYTEIWRSPDNNFSNASIIALVPVAPGEVNTYVDAIAPQISSDSYISRYYWIRRKVIT